MNYLMNSRDISEVTIVDKEAKEGHGVQRINATKVIFKLFYVHLNLYVNLQFEQVYDQKLNHRLLFLH